MKNGWKTRRVFGPGPVNSVWPVIEEKHRRAARPGGTRGNVEPAKFESTQHVRVLQATELENPRKPAPEERARGMSGIVEVAGKAHGSGEGPEKYVSPAYFVRVEGIGPVLVGEDWLEAEPVED